MRAVQRCRTARTGVEAAHIARAAAPTVGTGALRVAQSARQRALQMPLLLLLRASRRPKRLPHSKRRCWTTTAQARLHGPVVS